MEFEEILSLVFDCSLEYFFVIFKCARLSDSEKCVELVIEKLETFEINLDEQ